MPMRVVIVDDEWLSAVVLQREMEQQGYEVVGTAGTGTEALRVCRSASPDLVFMDIQMPGMDGIEATRELMEKRPTCVIIVTGRGRLEREAEQAGAMSYVVKPLFGSQIPSVVEEAQRRFGHFRMVLQEAASPEAALETWRVVQRAVHLLVGRETTTEDEAFRMVQQRAAEEGATLREAAEGLLARLVGPPQAEVPVLPS